MKHIHMNDNKTCVVCGEISVFRKHRIICSLCLNNFSKFRKNVNSAIYNSIKHGMKSYIWQFLPYSANELKNHLENSFSSWMNWNNYGTYKISTWNDRDLSTWTWQIDHIIPQSNFLFLSVEDGNFIDCWSLNNLKPISSKENVNKNIKEEELS